MGGRGIAQLVIGGGVRLDMDSADPTLSALLARARSFGATVVAIDVRASFGSYEAEFGRCRAGLVLSAALAQPGEDDSRYRIAYLDRLVAENTDAARVGMDIARRLAGALGATLHPSGPEPPRRGDPEWLAQQGPSPEREWTAVWRSVAWRADGTEVHASGEGPAAGSTGRLAMRDAMARHIGSVVPPFRYELGLKELGRGSRSYHEAAYPVGAPPMRKLREQAQEGLPLSAILSALAVEAPALSPLDRMIAVEHAFKIDLEALGPGSAFAAGAVEGAALDAALEGKLWQMQPQWSMPGALLDAYTSGQSVGPVLHAFYRDVSAIYLIMGVREAFGLSLGSAKMLVDTACSGTQDAELDAMLAEAVAAKGG
jgi:hypothetical protein